MSEPAPSCDCEQSPCASTLQKSTDVDDAIVTARAPVRSGGVVVSEDPSGPWAPYVYALGILGYDFGTEARRDSFKQLMAPADIGGTVVPANPYDSRQMVDHVTANPSEAKALIWTLNLELTPIYAIEAVGPYAASVYDLLTRLLAGEVAEPGDEAYIERVSIPGRRSDRTVKLFSGQVVPVVEVEQVRGLYGWQINALLGAATLAAQAVRAEATAEDVSESLREFLTRVYYDLRNLGVTSHDRALNFAATNAFQAAQTSRRRLRRGWRWTRSTCKRARFVGWTPIAGMSSCASSTPRTAAAPGRSFGSRSTCRTSCRSRWGTCARGARQDDLVASAAVAPRRQAHGRRASSQRRSRSRRQAPAAAHSDVPVTRRQPQRPSGVVDAHREPHAGIGIARRRSARRSLLAHASRWDMDMTLSPLPGA
jgi:hypothetical protein